MEFWDFSYRHEKELIQQLHPQQYQEIQQILSKLEPFPHGAIKGKTPKEYISEAFREHGWETERKIPLGIRKSDFCDIAKGKLFIEQEYSKFETLFRDFLRFMLLFDRGELDVGMVICYDKSAFDRWENSNTVHKSARATLQRATDFLQRGYKTVLRVPLWIIGIE